MNKFDKLFWTGIGFLSIPSIFILIMYLSGVFNIKPNATLPPPLPVYYDTVKVQIPIKTTVYDTVVVQKIKYIEKIKSDTIK